MGAAELETTVPSFRRPYAATASGRQALAHILRHLCLRPRDEIWITTTLGDRDLQVSPCVTATVARFCRFAYRPGPRTAAVLVIHDYGVPHPDLAVLRGRCLRHGWPLIEDAAHAFASTDDAGLRLGEESDFALFSLPKFFAVEAGGLVMGLPSPPAGPEELAVAARLLHALTQTDIVADLRRRNWLLLEQRFAQFGFGSALPLTPGSVPSLYVLHTTQQFSALRRLRSDGIEAGPDVHCNRLLLPCHQRLCLADIERIVAAVAAHATPLVATRQDAMKTQSRPIWLTAG
ncbi:MAG TPA: DegT/DnrJ/EryC1/StrS family aminotransferase, partial [Chloroflexota bacterium]|nr:DegT/DnrJ/EryC1/StrS family aminotransferase [Chloroflexota bacterium]